MKKFLDCIVLAAAVLFLIIVLRCSVAEGAREGRTLENPQAVIPGAMIVKNNQGGYNYFVKGKRVGYSRANVHGSYDIYIKGRLKYRGAHFDNTNVTRYSNSYNYNSSNNSYKPYRYQRSYINSARKSSVSRQQEVKAWTAKREAAHANRATVWDHFYPNKFK